MDVQNVLNFFFKISPSLTCFLFNCFLKVFKENFIWNITFSNESFVCVSKWYKKKVKIKKEVCQLSSADSVLQYKVNLSHFLPYLSFSGTEIEEREALSSLRKKKGNWRSNPSTSYAVGRGIGFKRKKHTQTHTHRL